MIKQPKLMLCCDCGYAVDTDKMFIKQYQNTAVFLCKKCAEKLQNEIKEKFENNSNNCNNKFRSLTDDEQSIYNNILKSDSKETGIRLF